MLGLLGSIFDTSGFNKSFTELKLPSAKILKTFVSEEELDEF